MPRGDFNAVVHSVFSKAVNLRVEEQDHLLSLVTADMADLPQGIRLESQTGFSFEGRLSTGDRLACREGILQDRCGRLFVDIHGAERWKCQLPRLNEITLPVAAAWASVWQALNERQRRIGVDICAADLFRADLPGSSAIARRMGALVRNLTAATRRLDPSVKASVARLLGLGPGLTPSGDDFLVGFLTGLRCTVGENAEHHLFFSDLGKMVIRLSRRINDISRTFLFHAAHGQVSSRLITLADAIAGGDNSAILLRAADDAMRVGHSSGMETVTGLLVGLSAWRNGLLPI